MKLHIKYAKDNTDQHDPHPKYQEFLQQKFMHQGPQMGGMGGMGRGGGGGSGGMGFQQFPAQPMYQDPYGGGFSTQPPVNNFGGQKAMRGRDVSSRYNPISRPQLGGMGAMGMGMGGGGRGLGGMGGMGGGIGGGPSPMGMGVNDPNAINLFCYFGEDPTDAEVYALFSKYGRISKVDIVRGKGYAFVHMPILAEADEAQRSLNGFQWRSDKTLQVSIKTKK